MKNALPAKDLNMMHDNAEYFSFANEDSLMLKANLFSTFFNRRRISKATLNLG